MNYKKLHNGKLTLKRPPRNQAELLVKLYGKVAKRLPKEKEEKAKS